MSSRPISAALFSLVVAGGLTASPALLADTVAFSPEAVAAKAQEAAPFCTAPPVPLSNEARMLCNYARTLPNCEALQKACEPPKAPDVPNFSGWKWLAKVAVYFVYAVVGAIGLGLLYALFVTIRRVIDERRSAAPSDSTKTIELAEERPEGDVATFRHHPAEELLQRADALLASGDRMRALSHYLAASLSALDEKGFLHVERSRTNGEYLRAVKDRDFRRELAPLVRAVDYAEFGKVLLEAEAIAPLAAAARSIVHSPRRAQAAEAFGSLPLAPALLALLLLGCGDDLTKKTGRPEGGELFEALATESKLKVTALSHPLERLPEPHGSDAMVVILDTELTKIDEETDHALTEWVYQGGRLLLLGPAHAAPTELAAALASKPTPAPSNEIPFLQPTPLPTQETENVITFRPSEITKAARALETHHAFVQLPDGKVSIPTVNEDEEEDEEEEEDIAGELLGCFDNYLDAANFVVPANTPTASKNRHAESRLEIVHYAPVSSEESSGPTFAAGRAPGAMFSLGEGRVVTFASSDLFRNVVLAHPKNPTLAVTLLRLAAGEGTPFLSADGLLTYPRYLPIERAQRHDGSQGASNPLSALIAAGLKLPLIHAAVFLLLLYVAYGRRFGRPLPDRLESRRAFAEHVEATGLLWAKRRVGPLALTAWVRLMDERIRMQMPRNSTDVPAFLAASSGASVEEVRKLWEHALSLAPYAKPTGDEIAILKTLAALVDALGNPSAQSAATASGGAAKYTAATASGGAAKYTAAPPDGRPA